MKAGNIMKAWGGIAGLQSCMDVMFDEAVQKRGYVSANVRQINGD